MTTERSSRPLRSDAVRNRERVFAAAERVFARAGLGASIEEIATEAGVGVGTVYRHFGSKPALIEALFVERIAEAVDGIERCADAPSGREALDATLRLFVGLQSRSRALQEVMVSDAGARAAQLRDEVEPLLTRIIERAKAEGAVRSDLAATDIPILTFAVAAGAAAMGERGQELARRHLELLIKGIGPTEDPVVIPPPLADDRFGDWLRAVGNAREITS